MGWYFWIWVWGNNLLRPLYDIMFIEYFDKGRLELIGAFLWDRSDDNVEECLQCMVIAISATCLIYIWVQSTECGCTVGGCVMIACNKSKKQIVALVLWDFLTLPISLPLIKDSHIELYNL